MPLLDIVQQEAAYNQIAVPTKLIGNVDSTAVFLVAAAQDAAESIARRPTNGWLAMIKEFDFTTAATGVLNGSVANTGPGGVAQITGLSSTTGIQPLTWYAFGTGLQINSIVATVDSMNQVTLNLPVPLPTSGTYQFGQSDYTLPTDFRWAVDGTFWDRSRFWAMRGPLSPQQWQLYKSSVIGKASIQRRFRFREVGGAQVLSIDPTPVDNGSNLVFEYMSNAWCKNATTGVGQTMWLADTDIGIIDEWLIKLGIRWRILRRLGLSYSEERDEFEREAERAIAREGSAPILDLTPNDQLSLIGPWNMPETGYGGVIAG